MEPCRYSPAHSSRRPIDMAIGVVIALRRCSEEQAFQHIVAAAHHTHVGLGATSDALIMLFGSDDGTADPVALKHWRTVFDEPSCTE